MKKWIFFALCLVICIGIFAGCGQTGEAQETQNDAIAGVFSVGYAKADVTPDDSVPLAGFGDNEQRYSTTVMDRIYATCIAFTDEEGTTVLMFGLDLLNTDEDRANEARALITEGSNGYWYFDLLYNGKPARILVRDKALADEIAAKDQVQLLFDDYNVAVGIVEK